MTGNDVFETAEGRITWTGNGECIVVDAWGPDGVRVRAGFGADLVDARWALLDPPRARHRCSPSKAAPPRS